MPDQRLRELEQAAATGSVHEQAAWMRERLRTGEECSHCDGDTVWIDTPHGRAYHGSNRYRCEEQHLEESICPRCAGLSLRQRVELAAYCGSEAARGVAGLPDDDCWWLSVDPEDPSYFSDWLQGLAGWGRYVLVRAAVAAARTAYQARRKEWGSLNVGEGRGYLMASLIPADYAITAVGAWMECPCEHHAGPIHLGLLTSQPNWSPSWLFASPPVSRPEEPPLAAAKIAGEQPIRKAIRADLISWALAV